MTYFFITDSRATDRSLAPSQLPVSLATSSTPAPLQAPLRR